MPAEVEKLENLLVLHDRWIRALRSWKEAIAAGTTIKGGSIPPIPTASAPSVGAVTKWENQSGGVRSQGYVVVQAGDRLFDDTATADDPDVIGVLDEDNIAVGQDGKVRHVGYQPVVNVQGNVTAGHYLRTSTTAGRAEDAGTTPTPGTFAMALTAYGGGAAGQVAGYVDTGLQFPPRDASAVTYTPAVLADWDGGADPGNQDAANDQLAERVTDLEGGAGHAAVTLGAGSDAALTLVGQELTLADVMTPTEHTAALHENGGADEINVAGLSGLLADGQTPLAHKDSHDPEDGSDALDTAAPANIDGVQASAAGTSHSLARADHGHRIQHSIADNALLTVDDAAVADNDFARFTANGIEGLTVAEVRTALTLPTYEEVTITIPTPAANDDFTIRTFKVATTLYEVSSVIVAGTNVVFNLYHGTDRSAAGTKALTADVTETSTTTGTVTGGASWADATMVAGAHLRCKIVSVSGPVAELSLTVRYSLT